MQLIHDPAPTMAGGQFRPDFAAVNPKCDVPVEDDDLRLTQSAAAARKVT